MVKMKLLFLAGLLLRVQYVCAYPQRHDLPAKVPVHIPADKKVEIQQPSPQPNIVEKSVVEMVKPKLMCPSGYHIFKDKCVQLMKRAVDFRCTKGFEISESKETVQCVKPVIQEPELVCLEGFLAQGGMCMKVKDILPEYQCPPNHKLYNRKCVPADTVPANVFCPDGSNLVDDQCVRLANMPPTFYCENVGFSLDRELLRCVGTEWKPVTYVCPTGTVPQRDGSCMETEKKPPQEACPPGSTQEGDVCVTTDTIELTSVCDGSSPSDQDDNCIVERVLPAQQRCPSGYSLNPETGTCQKILEAPLEPVCVEGVLDTSVNPPACKYQQSTLPALLCPEGYTRQGDVCEKRTEQVAQPTCEEGYSVSSDGSCVRRVPTDVEPYCPTGYEFRGDTCVKPMFENAKQMCPPGFEFKYGQCSTLEKTVPARSCSSGYALDGDECVSTSYKHPQPVCNCSNCELREGKCVIHEVRHPDAVCKEPFHLNEKTSLCEHEETKAPDAYCPPGFKYKGYGKNAPTKARCTRTDVMNPKAVCDKGYDYDPARDVCRGDAHVKHVPFEAAQSKIASTHPATVQHDTKPSEVASLYRWQ